jgi:hypothetical protein
MVTFRAVAPIFPVSDLQAARAHYEALGFDIHLHGDSGYGTAARDGVRIHLRLADDAADDTAAAEPPAGTGAAYIGVDDAEALLREWRAAGVGETGDLFDAGFGVWEAAHYDPDGNLVRFGSPLKPA